MKIKLEVEVSLSTAALEALTREYDASHEAAYETLLDKAAERAMFSIRARLHEVASKDKWKRIEARPRHEVIDYVAKSEIVEVLP